MRVHQTLVMPPAMAAGVCPTLMTMGDFFDAVTAHEREAKQLARTRRLIDRLRKPE